MVKRGSETFDDPHTDWEVLYQFHTGRSSREVPWWTNFKCFPKSMEYASDPKCTWIWLCNRHLAEARRRGYIW